MPTIPLDTLLQLADRGVRRWRQPSGRGIRPLGLPNSERPYARIGDPRASPVESLVRARSHTRRLIQIQSLG